jgi:hypothetical protein
MKKAYSTYVLVMLAKVTIVTLTLAFGLVVAGCDSASDSGGGGTTQDKVINIAAIAGVTAPAMGATPVTAITATAQYTGTAAWAVTGGAALSGSFAATTAYTATITLTAKEGYTLTGVKANFFTVAGATVGVTNAAGTGVITAKFPATGATDDRVALTAGSPVNALAADTSASVTFTGATGVTGLSTADFTVTGGTFTSASVTGDTATVVVGFAANATDAAKTITVAVNPSSTKIKGSASVTITHKAAGAAGITLEGLAAHLETLADNTAETPYTVALDSSVTINTADDSYHGVWLTINSTISTKRKYVLLDISACTAVHGETADTIEGDANGTQSHFNTIRYNQYIKGVTLPDTLTTIGDSAFDGCSYLTSVTIPDGVTTIGNSAFSSCSRLASVTIPDGVQSIGNSAFSSCTSLISVTIPGSVTTIGNYAFNRCTSLASVTIPDGGQSIGEYAFQYSGLASVTIPDGVTIIKKGAFSNCTSLASVTIPGSVTTIEDSAFSACTSLASVTIEEGTQDRGIKDKAFSGCTSLASVIIPSTVTNIGYQAFMNCTSLASVIIGESVSTIGGSAFYECSKLASVTLLRTSLIEDMSSDIFGYTDTSLKIYVPASLVEAYKASDGVWYVYADKIEAIPE